jgi:hypothetical protein
MRFSTAITAVAAMVTVLAAATSREKSNGRVVRELGKRGGLCGERYKDDCNLCFDKYPYCMRNDIPSTINWYAVSHSRSLESRMELFTFG